MNFLRIHPYGPIATSLLMIAIALSVRSPTVRSRSATCPTWTCPRFWSRRALPGASPETMASSVATPLENQFSMIAGLESMTSTNSLGTTQVILEFDLEPKPRWRCRRRAGRHHAGLPPAAAGHAHTADVRQGESGGPAHPLPRSRPPKHCRSRRSTNTPKPVSPSASPW